MSSDNSFNAIKCIPYPAISQDKNSRQCPPSKLHMAGMCYCLQSQPHHNLYSSTLILAICASFCYRIAKWTPAFDFMEKKKSYFTPQRKKKRKKRIFRSMLGPSFVNNGPRIQQIVVWSQVQDDLALKMGKYDFLIFHCLFLDKKHWLWGNKITTDFII